MKDLQLTEKRPRLKIFLDNLVGGMGWGLGTVLGAAVLFAVVGVIAAKLHAIPVIGEFVYNVVMEVEKLRGK